jgi:PEP-CTERM putative exosortase interaction domain
MNRIHLLIVLLAAIAVPFAAADTIQLNQNNLGISGSIGSVNLTQGSGGVMVTFTANSGYSLKLNGGDFLFDTNVALTAGSISNLKADGFSPNFGFTTGATRAGVTYSYDITNLMKGNLPKGYVSANTVSFFVSGVTLQQLETGNFGVHFCVGGGTSCGPSTGFAHGHSSAVPEPGTLSLLGTGILGLAGVMRRRFAA